MADPKVKHSHAHSSLLIVHSPTAIEESLHPTHTQFYISLLDKCGRRFKNCIAK